MNIKKLLFETKVGRFATMFLSQFTLYIIVVISYKAIANGDYVMVFVSDLVFAAFNFSVIKKIALDHNKDKIALMGYVLGSSIGSVTGLFFSQLISKM